MPKGLLFRLIVMGIAAVLASLYFRREATAPAMEIDAPSAAPGARGDADLQRDERGAAASAARLGPCEVTRVTDGDTLNVRCGGRKERVRMLQIDTPEREDPFYEEAGAALRALVAGRSVELELGPEERDDHGRLLATVFAGEENVNLAMIERGWSPYFDRYGPGAYPREFAEAERAARAAKRGIWALSP